MQVVRQAVVSDDDTGWSCKKWAADRMLDVYFTQEMIVHHSCKYGPDSFINVSLFDAYSSLLREIAKVLSEGFVDSWMRNVRGKNDQFGPVK